MQLGMAMHTTLMRNEDACGIAGVSTKDGKAGSEAGASTGAGQSTQLTVQAVHLDEPGTATTTLAFSTRCRLYNRPGQETRHRPDPISVSSAPPPR